MSNTSWTVAEAEAKLSQVIDQAQHEGPQIITRDGHKAAVLVACDEWERKAKRNGNLADFFAGSPLPGSDLAMERSSEIPAVLDL